MAALVCPCPRRNSIWAEFWWVDRQHRWIFFDDDEASETYAEQITNCPGCGRFLDRKFFRMASSVMPRT